MTPDENPDEKLEAIPHNAVISLDNKAKAILELVARVEFFALDEIEAAVNLYRASKRALARQAEQALKDREAENEQFAIDMEWKDGHKSYESDQDRS